MLMCDLNDDIVQSISSSNLDCLQYTNVLHPTLEQLYKKEIDDLQLINFEDLELINNYNNIL